jgi:hypothetical protein
MTLDPLVDELARLDRQRRREIVAAAEHARQQRIRCALKDVRRSILPDLKERLAARVIDDAVRGRRASFRRDPELRGAVVRQLQEELGSLDDIPGADRIRQILREQE